MMPYLNIRKNEYMSVFYGFIYSFLIISFFILSKSYRDSLFLNSFGKEDLSILYVINPIIIGLLVWFITYIFNEISLFTKSIVIHLFTFIFSLLLLLNLTDSLIFIYYIFVDFQISIIAYLFWKSLSSSFTTRQAKRLFGIITSGGFLSALLLGSTLSYLTYYLSQKELLILFNFLILFCPFFTFYLLKNSTVSNQVIINKNSDETIVKLFKNKYILNIISIIFLFSIISVFIDYNFKVSSFNKFSKDPEYLTNYFAQFYSIASFISFLFQIFISSHIFNRFGIAYSLLILPVLLLLISPFAYYFSSFIIIFLLKGNEQVFKSTLHDTSMQILWMPLPGYIKDAIKPLINILLKNIFSSIGGLLIIFSIYLQLDFKDIIPFLIICLLILINTMRKSKTYYINELVRAIDDRSLSFDNKDLVNFSNDVEMINIVNDKLKENKKDRYFVLKLLDKNIIEKCKDTLMEIFYDSDIKTQKIILKYFSDDRDAIKTEYLLEQVEYNNELSVVCLNILFERENKDIYKINNNLIKSDFLDLKYSAMNNCLKYDYDNRDKIINQINNNLNQKIDCQYIIKYIHPDYLSLNSDQFIKIINSLDFQSIANSLEFIKDINDIKIWNCILDSCSKQSFIDIKIVKFFQKTNQVDIFNYFKNQLLKIDYPIKKKIFINDLALKLDSDKAITTYEEFLKQTYKDDYTFDKICNSIIEIKNNNKSQIINKKLVDTLIQELTDSLYLFIRLSFLVDRDSKDRRLVEEYFKNRIKQKTEILIKLLYYSNDTLFKKNLNSTLFSNDLYLHKVIEIFEESLIEKYKAKVIPILDDITLLDKNNYSLKFYKHLKTMDVNHLLESNMLGKDQWYDFISSFEVADNNSNLFSDLIINNQYFKLLFSNSSFNEEKFLKKENIQLILKDMISSLEKTLYLKDSSIFQDIPAKELIYISHQLEEIQYSENSPIFKDGDVGDSMYFIFNGEVKISKGDVELISLSRGDYFGEMALLDGEPRSADADTISNTVLLKLESNKFKNILYSNHHVIKGVLSMLCDRLRNANNFINNK